MKKFDFGFINRTNVLVGNIKRVDKINNKMLVALRCCEAMYGDYSSACETTLVKENAIVLRLNNDWFIDIDNIQGIKDCELINELLKNETMDANRFMTFGIKRPYIGQLYLDSMNPCENIEQSVDNIVTLKLTNNNTLE